MYLNIFFFTVYANLLSLLTHLRFHNNNNYWLNNEQFINKQYKQIY